MKYLYWIVVVSFACLAGAQQLVKRSVISAVPPTVMTKMENQAISYAIMQDGTILACPEPGYGLYLQLTDKKSGLDLHYITPGQLVRETDILKFIPACLKIQ